MALKLAGAWHQEIAPEVQPLFERYGLTYTSGPLEPYSVRASAMLASPEAQLAAQRL